MKVAATAAEEDLPDVGSLLREGSFQQRMEAARKQRERVLAMRAAEADDESDLVVVHKPWGRQGWEAPQARRPAGPPVAEVVSPLQSDAADAGAARLPELVAASEGAALHPTGAKRGGFIIARTSWGFALGLGLGIAVATAIPYLRSQDAPAETAIVPAAEVPAAEVPAAAVPAAEVPAPTADASASPVVESAAPRSEPLQDESAVIIVPGLDAASQPVMPVFGIPAATDTAPTADLATQPILPGPSDWVPQAAVGPAPDAGLQGFAPAPGDKPMGARVASIMPDMARLADLPVAEQAPPPAAIVGAAPDFSATSIHILLSKGGNAGDASSLAGKLGAAGFTVTETAETDIAVRETNVRYYHQIDAEAAQALAAQLDVTARDFTGLSPAPPQGMIEVWVKGSTTEKAPAVVVKKAKAKANKKKPAAPAPDPAISEAQELQALRDRLLKQLQGGASP